MNFDAPKSVGLLPSCHFHGVPDKLHKSTEHFKARMQQVEDHMNSDAFAAPDGRGLLGLAKELRSRCEDMIRRGGQRIPK